MSYLLDKILYPFCSAGLFQYLFTFLEANMDQLNLHELIKTEGIKKWEGDLEDI